MDKKQRTVVSPKGVALFPHLSTPDEYMGERAYKCDLIMEPSDFQEFETALKPLWEEGYKYHLENQKGPKKMKTLPVGNKPWRPDTDEEGNETGRIQVRFKAKEKMGDKLRRPPRLFNPDHTPFEGNLYSGSILQIAAFVWVYYNPSSGVGIQLQPEAVLVHEAKSGLGGVMDENIESFFGPPQETEAGSGSFDADEVPF